MDDGRFIVVGRNDVTSTGAVGVQGRVFRDVSGLLFLAITDTSGNLLWICAAKPGRASDLTAAGHNKICAKLRAAGLGAIGGRGFTALEDNPEDPAIITGKRGPASARSPRHKRRRTT